MGGSKPLDQIIETDPNKWLVPSKMSLKRLNTLYDTKYIERMLARANWNPDLDMIVPFCKYLAAVCGLSGRIQETVLCFLIWAVSMRYIRDVQAFLESEEAQEIAGPVCVKFAEVLSRDGERQSVPDSDPIHDWCEDLENLK